MPSLWNALKHPIASGLLLAVVLTAAAWSAPRDVAAASCQLKANTEPVEVTVLVGGKEFWRDKIPQGETRQVTVPDGPFTVVSSVYNANLKTKEDIRTDAHTKMCEQQATLNVPLFAKQ